MVGWFKELVYDFQPRLAPVIMATTIRKLTQPFPARTYLLEKTSADWPSTLNTLVRARNDFSMGSFYSALPETVEVDQLREFKWDLTVPGFSSDASVAHLASVVKEFIREPNNAVLLFDYHNSPSDPGWEDYGLKHHAATFGDELYWQLKGLRTPARDVETLVADWAVYFPYVGYFYVSSSTEESSSLTHPELEAAAINLIGVTVDAFDGNSFLLWWRQDLCPLRTLMAT